MVFVLYYSYYYHLFETYIHYNSHFQNCLFGVKNPGTVISYKSRKYQEKYLNKELELYMRPLDANGKYKEMQMLLKIYGLDLSKSELYYISTKK